MKRLPLAFAALGFLALVAPAYGGWTNCGTHFPGHCRLHCSIVERSLFMCDRYRLCCIKDTIPRSIVKTVPKKRKKQCRQSTKTTAMMPLVPTLTIAPASSSTPSSPASPPATPKSPAPPPASPKSPASPPVPSKPFTTIQTKSRTNTVP